MTSNNHKPTIARISPVQAGLSALGRSMYELACELYPICRSLTGAGTRKSLDLIRRVIPLELHEVPTGTKVLDWTIPNEWNIREAWVKDSSGRKIVDFAASNLHIVNYSHPIHARVSLTELKDHLHTLPEHSDWIPYRTSYYRETWGFCMAHRTASQLAEGEYEVFIDSTLEPGKLTYGEYFLQGRLEDEVLISCHVCHPSLANDNLSGMTLAAFLASELTQMDRRYSYRFLFIPGTIGSIAWLASNRDKVGRIKHGLVVACVGDAGPFTYKKSRGGDAEIDRVARRVFKRLDVPNRVVDFSPYGYDERQFCSPGFDLPVGCLSRTPHGEYPEYHSSADSLDLISAPNLAQSLRVYLAVLNELESARRFVNMHPEGEPQLGKRGLYRALGGMTEAGNSEMAMLWLLSLSDGTHSLTDIAGRSGIPEDVLSVVAAILVDKKLLEEQP